MGSVPLVGRGGDGVATQGGDVDSAVGGKGHGIDEHPCADGVGGRDDRFQIGGGAEQVGGGGQGDPPGAFVDERDHVFGGQGAGHGVERGQDMLRAGALGGHVPRGDVGIVIQAGTDDAIARLQGDPHGPRERERE